MDVVSCLSGAVVQWVPDLLQAHIRCSAGVFGYDEEKNIRRGRVKLEEQTARIIRELYGHR